MSTATTATKQNSDMPCRIDFRDVNQNNMDPYLDPDREPDLDPGRDPDLDPILDPRKDSGQDPGSCFGTSRYIL